VDEADRRTRVARCVEFLGGVSNEWTMNPFLDQRVLERLRAEYLEMPGLKLRIEQVQRLCGIEQTTCKFVLDALVNSSFLCLKSDGTYVRLTEGSSPRARPVKATVTSPPIVMTSRRAS
jgi:hypothetical protein